MEDVQEINLRIILPVDGRIVTVALSDEMTPSEILKEFEENDIIEKATFWYALYVKGGTLLKPNKSIRKQGLNGGETVRIVPMTDAG